MPDSESHDAASASPDPREGALQAFRERRLRVDGSVLQRIYQSCVQLQQVFGQCLTLEDGLGLTVHGAMWAFARDLLPRSKKFNGSDLAIVETIALQSFAHAVPDLVMALFPTTNPDSLEEPLKKWWLSWSGRLYPPTTQPATSQLSPLVRRIAFFQRRVFVAPLEVQLAHTKYGAVRSREGKEVEEQLQAGDPQESELLLMAVLLELLGETGNDSGLFFIGDDGCARVGATQVRDKLRKPRRSKPPTSLDEQTASEGGDPLGSQVLSDSEPDVLEAVDALDAVHCVAYIRDRLASDERRATSKADKIVARYYLDLAERTVTLSEVARREGIAPGRLSEAKNKLEASLRRDPRLAGWSAAGF